MHAGELMDNIGGYVNPLRLLQRIPDGVPIQGLRDRLVHIIADFRTQTSLREGCNNILHTDCLLLAQVSKPCSLTPPDRPRPPASPPRLPACLAMATVVPSVVQCWQCSALLHGCSKGVFLQAAAAGPRASSSSSSKVFLAWMYNQAAIFCFLSVWRFTCFQKGHPVVLVFSYRVNVCQMCFVPSLARTRLFCHKQQSTRSGLMQP